MRRLVLLLLLACHHDSGATADTGDAGGTPSALADLVGGPCMVEVAMPPDEGHAHVEFCKDVSYRSKPPSSGNHYPSWPAFRVYSKPVPWGYLIHGLEHGAVVIAYNCPGGCADQLAQVQQLYDATPKKPGCPTPQLIVTPDPTLDVPFAASAWGYTLRAKCFDKERFAGFVQRRTSMAPEDTCGSSLDCEATDWCAAPQLCPRR